MTNSKAGNALATLIFGVLALFFFVLLALIVTGNLDSGQINEFLGKKPPQKEFTLSGQWDRLLVKPDGTTARSTMDLTQIENRIRGNSYYLPDEYNPDGLVGEITGKVEGDRVYLGEFIRSPEPLKDSAIVYEFCMAYELHIDREQASLKGMMAGMPGKISLAQKQQAEARLQDMMQGMPKEPITFEKR